MRLIAEENGRAALQRQLKRALASRGSGPKEREWRKQAR